MNEDYCLWMGDVNPNMNESMILNIFQLYNVHPICLKLIKNAIKNKNHCLLN